MPSSIIDTSKFNWKACKFYQGNALLLDKESAQNVIQELNQRYKINTDVGFKTPSYKYFKFLKQEDLEQIKSYPHLVTSNYGINPIWLLWLVCLDGINYSLYINCVSQQVIWSKHRFAPRLYRKATLFEGEIIRNSKFLIWDILVNRGKDVMQVNLNQRLDIINAILNFLYTHDEVIENLEIECKVYVEYKYIKSLVEDHLKYDRDNQGLLFIPIRKSVKCFSFIFDGNHRIDSLPKDMNQLEEVDLYPQKITYGKHIHTNDASEIREFWLSKVPKVSDNYYLYHIKNMKLIRIGLCMISSKEKSLELQNLFKEKKGTNRNGVKQLLPFKCRYIKRFRKWEPIELIEDFN